METGGRYDIYIYIYLYTHTRNISMLKGHPILESELAVFYLTHAARQRASVKILTTVSLTKTDMKNQSVCKRLRMHNAFLPSITHKTTPRRQKQ